MNPLKPSTGKLIELENEFINLKNKSTKHLEIICKMIDNLKRNGYNEKQLKELNNLIKK